MERLAVFVPSLPTLCFNNNLYLKRVTPITTRYSLLCISVTGARFSRGRGGSWLGCQVLPAIGAPGTQPPKSDAVVYQQCVVYHFKCDLCDADYVGYTC